MNRRLKRARKSVCTGSGAGGPPLQIFAGTFFSKLTNVLIKISNQILLDFRFEYGVELEIGSRFQKTILSMDRNERKFLKTVYCWGNTLLNTVDFHQKNHDLFLTVHTE